MGFPQVLPEVHLLRSLAERRMRRAVILAGGGYAASAWELGIVTGMADAGLDVRNADLFVGTSSGSRVALHLASGAVHEEAFERRLQPGPPSSAGPSMSGASRREIVAAQLPTTTWPEKRLLIAVVNANTRERRAFDRDSGIDLVDAVIATTASAGMPPVLFQGEHYVDGGFRSTDNADLASGVDRVLILALKRPPEIPQTSVFSLDETVKMLRDGGTLVEVVQPDDDTQAALAAAGGVLNPSISAPAARAGRAQGRRIVGERVSAFWLPE